MGAAIRLLSSIYFHKTKMNVRAILDLVRYVPVKIVPILAFACVVIHNSKQTRQIHHSDWHFYFILFCCLSSFFFYHLSREREKGGGRRERRRSTRLSLWCEKIYSFFFFTYLYRWMAAVQTEYSSNGRMNDASVFRVAVSGAN